MELICLTQSFELGIQSASVNSKYSCLAVLMPKVSANFFPGLWVTKSSISTTTRCLFFFASSAKKK